MKIVVNGEGRELRDGTTVAELLDALGTARTGVAVACNDKVVRRSAYEQHRINQGDRVEIIKAVAGG
jgi:sulfur carrier protein